MASKHALLIGVSRYGEGFLPIPSALLDVEALARVLRDPELGDFPEAQVQVLPDPDSGTMAKAVEIFFANRDPDDLLLLYFSGHGWREKSRLLFCCQGTAKFMEGPQRGSVLQSTALKAEDVQRWMEASRSKHQVLILDCCYSAAFAEGMSAKGNGAIAFEDTFGGRGRAVLTSSDAIETSSAPESGDDLSVYTRFLVEGIRTGAADRQQRGFVDAEDLHTYVSRRVAEAAPAMTPQFIPTREGHRIVVCKARRDPTVAYRQEVEKLAGERSGVISPAGRALLDDLKRELALPQHATEAIEAEVLQPFRDYAEKISRYQQALVALAAALPEPGSLLSPVDQEELALLEKRFKLRGSDVEALHRRLGIRFGEPEAAITTIDADPPPTSPSSEPQEGPSAGGGEVSLQPITTTHGWLVKEGDRWQVKTKPVEVQGYREELAPGVAITMLRIPAGSFLMGSPANEQERASDEGPQHEVQLQEFFLSPDADHPGPVAGGGGLAEGGAGSEHRPRQFQGLESAGGAGELARGDGVLPPPERTHGQTLWPAERGPVGIRLPGGHHHAVPLRRHAHGGAGQLRRHFYAYGRTAPKGMYRKQTTDGGQLPRQCLGPARHARQRVGVVRGPLA